MLNDNQRASNGQVLQELYRVGPLLRTHAGERFVEQQNLRIGAEREANLQPSLLAVGELAHRHIGTVGQVQEPQRLGNVGIKLIHVIDITQHVGAIGAACPRERGDQQIAPHCQLREQLVDLIALGNAKLAHRRHIQRGDVLTEQQDLARTRPHLAGQHLEERALARAIGADQTADFALVQDKVDAVIGDHAPIALAEAMSLDGDTIEIGWWPVRRHHRFGGCRANRGHDGSLRHAGRTDKPPEIGNAPDNAAPEKYDQHDEHHAQHELPGRSEAERRLQLVAQVKPERAADKRAEQCSGAADHRLHDQFPGRVEGEGLR